MKKSRFKKLTSLILASVAFAAFSLASCGGNGGNNSDEEMIVDLGSLMPTSNTTATVDNPEVIQASKYIAEEYKKLTGVTVKWATEYGRSTGDDIEKITQWYSTKMSTGTCPVIGYTALNYYQDRDWYVTLDEYLDKPNPYAKAGEAGSVKWRDMFYDYVLEDNTVQNVKGEIVALPIVLSAGSQTAIFYNKDLVKKTPSNWEEYKNVLEGLKGVDRVQPYSGYTSIGLYQWAMQFNLTPQVLAGMNAPATEKYGIDYDGNGELTNLEVLRGVLEGKFDPTKADSPARQVYKEAYNYYRKYLEGNKWVGRDYKTSWDSGKLAMIENGLWQIPMEENNTARKFEYGIFPMPIADENTFKTAAKTEYYDSYDDVICPVSVALNVMKPAVLNSDGTYNQAKLDRAIDFLMFLTSVENNTQIAEEKGGTKGAVKGSGYNALIDNIGWKEMKFPKVSYSATWPTGYTSVCSGLINKDFEMWVTGSGKMSEATFMKNLNTNQTTGAKEFVKAFSINTTGWNLAS